MAVPSAIELDAKYLSAPNLGSGVAQVKLNNLASKEGFEVPTGFAGSSVPSFNPAFRKPTGSGEVYNSETVDVASKSLQDNLRNINAHQPSTASGLAQQLTARNAAIAAINSLTAKKNAFLAFRNTKPTNANYNKIYAGISDGTSLKNFLPLLREDYSSPTNAPAAFGGNANTGTQNGAPTAPTSIATEAFAPNSAQAINAQIQNLSDGQNFGISSRAQGGNLFDLGLYNNGSREDGLLRGYESKGLPFSDGSGETVVGRPPVVAPSTVNPGFSPSFSSVLAEDEPYVNNFTVDASRAYNDNGEVVFGRPPIVPPLDTDPSAISPSLSDSISSIPTNNGDNSFTVKDTNNATKSDEAVVSVPPIVAPIEEPNIKVEAPNQADTPTQAPNDGNKRLYSAISDKLTEGDSFDLGLFLNGSREDGILQGYESAGLPFDSKEDGLEKIKEYFNSIYLDEYDLSDKEIEEALRLGNPNNEEITADDFINNISKYVAKESEKAVKDVFEFDVLGPSDLSAKEQKSITQSIVKHVKENKLVPREVRFIVGKLGKTKQAFTLENFKKVKYTKKDIIKNIRGGVKAREEKRKQNSNSTVNAAEASQTQVEIPNSPVDNSQASNIKVEAPTKTTKAPIVDVPNRPTTSVGKPFIGSTEGTDNNEGGSGFGIPSIGPVSGIANAALNYFRDEPNPEGDLESRFGIPVVGPISGIASAAFDYLRGSPDKKDPITKDSLGTLNSLTNVNTKDSPQENRNNSVIVKSQEQTALQNAERLAIRGKSDEARDLMTNYRYAKKKASNGVVSQDTYNRIITGQVTAEQLKTDIKEGRKATKAKYAYTNKALGSISNLSADIADISNSDFLGYEFGSNTNVLSKLIGASNLQTDDYNFLQNVGDTFATSSDMQKYLKDRGSELSVEAVEAVRALAITKFLLNNKGKFNIKNEGLIETHSAKETATARKFKTYVNEAVFKQIDLVQNKNKKNKRGSTKIRTLKDLVSFSGFKKEYKYILDRADKISKKKK